MNQKEEQDVNSQDYMTTIQKQPYLMISLLKDAFLTKEEFSETHLGMNKQLMEFL